MSPELMMKRGLLPMNGPQAPIAAAIGTAVGSAVVGNIITGAIIGAVPSAVTGGDILKGALLGGLGGAMSSALSTSSAAAEAAAGAGNTTNMALTGVGEDAIILSGESAGGALNTITTPAATEAAASAAAPAVAEAAPAATQAAAQSTSTTLLNATPTNSVDVANTGLIDGTKNTGIAQQTSNTSILDKILNSDRTMAAGIQVAGNAILGNMQGEAQGQMQEEKWKREDEQNKAGTVRVRKFTSGALA